MLVAGTNGSGKSTFTLTLKRHYPSTKIIDPDAIAKELTGSASTINQARARAGRIAVERIREYIASGASFIAESTISGHTYLRYINLKKSVRNGIIPPNPQLTGYTDDLAAKIRSPRE